MLCECKVALSSLARTESARNSPLQSECTSQSVQWASCSLEGQLFLSWYKGLFTLGFDKNSPGQTLVWFLWTLYPTRPWLWALCLSLLSPVLARIWVTQLLQNYGLGIICTVLCDDLIPRTLQCLFMIYNMAAKSQSLDLNLNQSDTQVCMYHGSVVFLPTFLSPPYVNSLYFLE